MLKKGTQIIYVPAHIEVSLNPSDAEKLALVVGKQAEPGFVSQTTATTNHHVFCRFWSKHRGGRDLRTRTNSESTPMDSILLFDTAPQDVVDAWLTIIDYEQGE